ncbi:MAG: hypothetical protein A2583_09620 [Bdellovibrionales bacterium RIFOXYD1_FULL_53_11]|nr:MAG: hypothetical protein A2583_09620 [Bdellovibrionales bacterium RIFOXYD1_FULL_53_11]
MCPDNDLKPTLTDFPKLHCPFIRQTFKINKDWWKERGAQNGLRTPEVYLVVNRVNPGYEWVFDDPDTFAVEKLDGTNVKLLTEKGRLVALQNRLNVVDLLQIVKGKTFIIEGIFQAIGKDYVKTDGEQAGEVIGPKLQKNPYKLDTHLWYPFEKAITDLRYKSFDEHARTFDNWSAWFKDHLVSRFYTKRASKLGLTDKVMAEGIILYNLRRRAEKKSWMAKLRRNMFDWFYEGCVIEGYSTAGRDEAEDQEKFD